MKEQITGVVRQLLWLSPTIVSADVVERGCFPNSPSEPFPMQAPDCHVFLKQQLGEGCSTNASMIHVWSVSRRLQGG